MNTGTFKVVLRCHDCGEKLNDTVPMTAKEIVSAWMRLVTSSPLVARSCPKGCRPTYSDCNANTDMVIVDVATGTDVDYEALKATA